MKNIILVGSHGTGKTTLLKAYKEKYGMSIRDGVSRPVHKCSKLLNLTPWEEQKIINELTLFYWNYNKDIPDLGMTRSPLDCIVYSEVFGFEDLRDEVVEEFGKLDLNDVIFIYIPIMFKLEDDGVRFMDEKLQKDIDNSMKYYLDKLNIKYYTIKSNDINERVEELRNIIEEENK